MMNSRELRIGNYLGGRNGIVTVSAIQEDGTVWLKEGGKNFIVDSDKPCLLPIPLTEEWLLKFGFLTDLDNDIFLNINCNSFLCWQNNRVELLDDENNKRICFCEYVHQLQNLYFALTNEELTYEQ